MAVEAEVGSTKTVTGGMGSMQFGGAALGRTERTSKCIHLLFPHGHI